MTLNFLLIMPRWKLVAESAGPRGPWMMATCGILITVIMCYEA
jgi:hypothetical protein